MPKPCFAVSDSSSIGFLLLFFDGLKINFTAELINIFLTYEASCTDIFLCPQCLVNGVMLIYASDFIM